MLLCAVRIHCLAFPRNFLTGVLPTHRKRHKQINKLLVNERHMHVSECVCIFIFAALHVSEWCVSRYAIKGELFLYSPCDYSSPSIVCISNVWLSQTVSMWLEVGKSAINARNQMHRRGVDGDHTHTSIACSAIKLSIVVWIIFKFEFVQRCEQTMNDQCLCADSSWVNTHVMNISYDRFGCVCGRCFYYVICCYIRYLFWCMTKIILLLVVCWFRVFGNIGC